MVFSLFHPLDTENPITEPTLCGALIANMLAINIGGTVGTLVVGCASSEKHDSRRLSSNVQVVPPQAGRYTVGIIIAGIALVATVYLWRYLGSSVRIQARGRSSRQGGRSEAVAETQDGPQHGGNSGKSQPRHGRPAAVISTEIPSYHAPPPRRAMDRFMSLGKEPEELNNCTVADPKGSTTHFQRVIIAGRRMLKAWGWTLIDQPGPAVIYPPIRSPNPRSLHRSLHTGARDLGESFLALGQCIFLVVGVDTRGQKDAENDTKYLRQMFESALPSIPRFECIYGADATYTKIHETVLALLGEVRTISRPSQVLMLFTGTGDGNNTMCLSNGEVLSESDLSQWLSASPIDQINVPNISALFDICRMGAS
ncbi:unnamed protein product [Rhizoctonia solani]|uniref:Uncharacterized protein n=1 Tax=Rhizoctonia solani TaxID=456999 RepID=A0A8H3GQN7_9AGAM|nr:unnamed protein product [Rhizoctonia solani]